MLKFDSADHRELRCETLACNLAVVGGGLAGVCCAITAARAGLRVVLMQDRPVLGGNSSSEVRLWVLGATSHQGNNNRWAREGGVIDEILVENLYRNPEGNPLIFDTVLLEKVVNEKNITLLLNTSCHEVTKHDADAIASVRGFCSQNGTMYDVHAPLFCDASGDGTVGFLAGAAFRMGAESRDEFGEKFAPSTEYGQLLGHTIYFYSKDTGKPVRFVPPSFALRDIKQIPRWRQFNAREYGCQLWWIEYGGRLDTVHDAERIKWELWKVVYGVWDHIKNSGLFPESENLTLEWVGTIPGKRESRRFEGDYMLIQQDLIEQRRHADAVSFGGWAIDLHPADGVFSEKPGCNQWHSKGVYQIPYRCLYSRNIGNLFLAGRIISASHVAFGSTRVMATCAHGGQAVGMAAALCIRQKLRPRELNRPERMEQLQRQLQRSGQFIPGLEVADAADLAASARVSANSRFVLSELPDCGRTVPLAQARAMLLPVPAGRMPRLTFFVEAGQEVTLTAELRTCSREGSFTPDVLLAKTSVKVSQREPVLAASGCGTSATPVLSLPSGGAPEPQSPSELHVDFDTVIDRPRYVFVILRPAPGVALALSDIRVTGVMALANKGNHRVADAAVQTPPADIGVECFEFFLPERRPRGQNLAMRLEPGLDVFGPQAVTGGPDRPTSQPNAFVASLDDPAPSLELAWKTPQRIARVELSFDTDFDHAMESVLMGHPERVMPLCVRQYRIVDDTGRVLAEVSDNHQTRNVVALPEPANTTRLRIEMRHPSATVPAALFRVRCYPE